jgi:sterol 3beta-glucosyltransferase
MKVALVTFGTRGDVEPFVALAQRLRRAGHDAYLTAPSNFAGLATRHGVPFRPFSCDTEELAQRPDVKRILDSGSTLRFLKAQMRQAVLDEVNLDVWRLTEDAEAMAFRAGAPPAAYSIACKRGIPSVEVMYLPLEPSGELPAVGAGMRRPGGRVFNRAMGHVTYQVFWRMFAPSANRFRRDVLQMPRLPFWGPRAEYARRRHPIFCTYSPAVLPRPHDWRPDVHVVGYLFLEEPPGWQPPADLCAFLAAGPKPLYVGLGSMTTTNPGERARTLLEGLRRSGQRGVFQGGWAKLDIGRPLPEEVFPLEEAPFAWLFPRMAAIVHHGGAGTTSFALRAGLPSIVLPHNFDQPYWAQRLYELGVSPRPLLIQKITADSVAAAIAEVMKDAAMRRRAAAIGEQIRSEDGIGRAVELFTQYVERFRSGG